MFNGVARLNTWSTRVDYQPTNKDSINARFTLSRNFTNDIGTSNGVAPSISTSLTYRDYSTVVTWTHNIGSKNVAQTELQSLDSQIAQLEQQQEQMTASEQKLRTKIEQFRSKKEVIKAQYSAAEAQVRISEAATGVGEEMADVGLAMQRALDKTENMKARRRGPGARGVGTFEDLTQLGSGDDDIDASSRSSRAPARSTTTWRR